MPNEIFNVENLVILTSKIEIDCNQWVDHIKNDYWKPLIKKINTRFLVLTGIHGGADGKLGDMDHDMFLDYEYAINGLKRDFKDDIVKHNIEIFLENIGDHIDSSKLINEEKLVAVIKKYNPTIISLAFCYTEVSEINNILRAAGIYTVLIMSQDRAELTQGKYVVLDDKQKEIVEQMAKEQPQNLILWGSSGTGKTILLAQALGIKVSHFKRQNIEMKIIVSTFGNHKRLMEDIRNKYLGHSKLEKKDFILFEKLCGGMYQHFEYRSLVPHF